MDVSIVLALFFVGIFVAALLFYTAYWWSKGKQVQLNNEQIITPAGQVAQSALGVTPSFGFVSPQRNQTQYAGSLLWRSKVSPMVPDAWASDPWSSPANEFDFLDGQEYRDINSKLVTYEDDGLQLPHEEVPLTKRGVSFEDFLNENVEMDDECSWDHAKRNRRQTVFGFDDNSQDQAPTARKRRGTVFGFMDNSQFGYARPPAYESEDDDDEWFRQLREISDEALRGPMSRMSTATNEIEDILASGLAELETNTQSSVYEVDHNSIQIEVEGELPLRLPIDQAEEVEVKKLSSTLSDVPQGTSTIDLFRLFSTLNKDGDTELSVSEIDHWLPPQGIVDALAAHLHVLDPDGHGHVNGFEILAALDANHDGHISVGEFIFQIQKVIREFRKTQETKKREGVDIQSALMKLFDSLNQNSQDTSLSEKELGEWVPSSEVEIALKAKMNLLDADNSGSADAKSFLSALDTNGDGQVSVTEFVRETKKILAEQKQAKASTALTLMTLDEAQQIMMDYPPLLDTDPKMIRAREVVAAEADRIQKLVASMNDNETPEPTKDQPLEFHKQTAKSAVNIDSAVMPQKPAFPMAEQVKPAATSISASPATLNRKLPPVSKASREYATEAERILAEANVDEAAKRMEEVTFDFSFG